MGSVLRVLAAAAAAVVLVTTVVRAAAPEAAAAVLIPDSLVIRIYDNAGVSATERARAIARADSILNRAGIDAEWIGCPARKYGQPSPLCDRPPARAELVVRLINAPVDDDEGARRQTLGYSLIDTTTRRGTLATVFLDRVTRLASAAETDASATLGRAIAHEIGHLILGTNEHSPAGIMRETWTWEQLTSNRLEDWLFLPNQREQLRHARLLGMPAVAVGNRGASTPGG